MTRAVQSVHMENCQSLICVFGVPGGGKRNRDRNNI